MNNPNALIAMACFSQNADNPYLIFCQYIKYCIFTSSTDVMSIIDIINAVGDEFGLILPYNVAVECLSRINKEDLIIKHNHQIKRIGAFDTDAFECERNAYREKENALIESLVNYVRKYGQDWSFEYAREQLIKVLDLDGLAYDIFIHGNSVSDKNKQTTMLITEFDEPLEDEDSVDEIEDEEKQPLYSDSNFVGRFIEQILSTDGIQNDYLKRICEGMMICVGAYQLPSANSKVAMPQIKNTDFFFDTRLLLRFVGCACEAAVEAVRELVCLIQSKGGKIYYYPQTLEEMNRAFDEAINSLMNDYPPTDEEMRIYAVQKADSISVLRSKRATLEQELADKKIYLREHKTFTEEDRIQFGFDRNDFQQYMRDNLSWDSRTIENDAYSLWETHMLRRGDYSDYCGTQSKLQVFVTSNARLMRIALRYREEKQSITGIYGWKYNRLPVITDIRLTCRLWTPSEQSERLSLLYLTSNAVAAQRPTRRYVNNVRQLAIEIKENIPEYSSIPLPSFFEDNITDAMFEKTMGLEDSFNIGNFASTLTELSELKARDQEKITEQVRTEFDKMSNELDQQTKSIVDGAVEDNKNRLGLIGVALKLIKCWPIVISIMFVPFSSLLSYALGSWHLLWIILIPTIVAVVEKLFASNCIRRAILKKILPKLEVALENNINNKLRKVEKPHKDIIIKRIKEKSDLWVECVNMSRD